MTPFIQLRSACYLLLLVVIYAATPVASAQRNATSQSVTELINASPANIIVVTNTNDSGPGSLRNALATGDTIDATGVSGTILLTSGVLRIGGNQHIIGPGAGNLAVNGNAASGVFEVEGGGFGGTPHVTISGLTITNGVVGISNVCSTSNVGFSCFKTLTITNCTVSGNSGAGISNIASSMGPGADVELTVSNCTINGNSGGGISNIASAGEMGRADAELTVSNCTISGNSASNGGGIFNGAGAPEHNATANVAISNSTFSGNSAGNGGAIYNTASLVNAIVTLGSTILNAGASGGTIFN